ncbi:class I SAM-dependent methyltransferase [Natronomonas sp. F2-12]|jgi:cyclopropane-fatty-acyl-phospholipid synthase|uniref:Class I SAM-dependent methyltransferase n=1 Tax=Natronomonas aquatica TaxID=2841590 RepID=A0A9R1CRD5_9EURY|nr:class I SAM-dependent methyltransferase [Natronomonas aquatica]MCQ4332490.1 class I SAM-dependent methyltransferase [Natronomonas aquatica]
MKDAVRRNFDESPTAYEEYEAMTGRFATLSDRLYDLVSARTTGPIGTVLDAGAGTGISSRRFADCGTPVALDLSRAMLEANPVEHRVQGDFDSLPFGADNFDAVVFTASLFLTPEPERAVREARRVLRPGGPVGAVAPLGWIRADGEDVFRPLSRESRSPASAEAVGDALAAVFETETGVWSFETTAEALRTFHTVPAMAARLYPRLSTDARIERTRELLEDVEGPLEQRWRWFLGV